MAISLPCMTGVKKRAEIIGCQSNQRQWGIAFTGDDESISYLDRFQPFLRAYANYDKMNSNSLRTDVNGVYLCPSARRIGRPVPSLGPDYLNLEAWDGNKARAWAYRFRGRVFTSSYTVNLMRENMPCRGGDSVERPSEVPILFDSTFRLTGLVESDDPPPAYDDMPRGIPTYKDTRACSVCIDRHCGGINVLHLDRSVKKVGLKELWTLKWNDQFGKNGPWTNAGGVQANDWPDWMRGFRDY